MSIFLTTGGPINFPGLELAIEHLIKGFEVFGIHISLSGILLAAALLLGLLITERLAKKTEQNKEIYLDLAIRVVLAGLLGARVGYVLTHWKYFITDQRTVFDISDGGMSFMGAMIAGLVVSFVYCKQKKLSWFQICGTALPGVVTGQILASVGCFFDRGMLGTFSDGTFAMQVAMQDVDSGTVALSRSSQAMVRGNFLQVHPVALYEAVLLLVLLMLLVILWKCNCHKGVILAIYLIAYGTVDFALEFIRLDSLKLMKSIFSVEHIISAVIILFGIALLVDQLIRYHALRKAQPKNFNSVVKTK